MAEHGPGSRYSTRHYVSNRRFVVFTLSHQNLPMSLSAIIGPLLGGLDGHLFRDRSTATGRRTRAWRFISPLTPRVIRTRRMMPEAVANRAGSIRRLRPARAALWWPYLLNRVPRFSAFSLSRFVSAIESLDVKARIL